jgi:hypothetical protein
MDKGEDLLLYSRDENRPRQALGGRTMYWHHKRLRFLSGTGSGLLILLLQPPSIPAAASAVTLAAPSASMSIVFISDNQLPIRLKQCLDTRSSRRPSTSGTRWPATCSYPTTPIPPAASNLISTRFHNGDIRGRVCSRQTTLSLLTPSLLSPTSPMTIRRKRRPMGEPRMALPHRRCGLEGAFAPTLLGLAIQDRGPRCRRVGGIAVLTFSVSPSSNKGFIRVSAKDPRSSSLMTEALSFHSA